MSFTSCILAGNRTGHRRIPASLARTGPASEWPPGGTTEGTSNPAAARRRTGTDRLSEAVTTCHI